jgi:penicillin-binding protein 1A
LEKALIRIPREILVLLTIRAIHNQDDLVKLYLHRVYLGTSNDKPIHGVEDGARFYFSKDMNSLNLAESATLVAISRNPSSTMTMNPKHLKDRRDKILRQMYERKVITESMYQEAIQVNIEAFPSQDQPNNSLKLTANETILLCKTFSY